MGFFFFSLWVVGLVLGGWDFSGRGTRLFVPGEKRGLGLKNFFGGGGGKPFFLGPLFGFTKFFGPPPRGGGPAGGGGFFFKKKTAWVFWAGKRRFFWGPGVCKKKNPFLLKFFSPKKKNRGKKKGGFFPPLFFSVFFLPHENFLFFPTFFAPLIFCWGPVGFGLVLVKKKKKKGKVYLKNPKAKIFLPKKNKKNHWRGPFLSSRFLKKGVPGKFFFFSPQKI